VVVYAIADFELEDRHGLGRSVGEVHFTRAEADAELAEMLADEPTWLDRLRVVEVDLGGEPFVVSLN